jgi:hypothetical protein
MDTNVLSIDQQFSLLKIKNRLEETSEEDIKIELVEVFQKIIMQETYYKKAIGKKWGLTQAEKPNDA